VGLEKLSLSNHAKLAAGVQGSVGFTPGLSQYGAVGRGHQDVPEEAGPKGLLEQAGIDRFSMCFNNGASGVLNLGTPNMTDSLGSVGKFHWGLDFRGITIGNSTAPLAFCSSDNMTHGQETPCGAIPDSGTTVIMAPMDQLSSLLDSICDGWDRCAKNYTALVKATESAKKAAAADYGFDPFEIAPVAKSSVLQLLLLDCGSWMDEGVGLNELPPLKFHVTGSGGNNKTLAMPGWAYILESTRVDAAANKKFQGGLEEDIALLERDNHTGASSKVCSPAFGAMDYNTQKNGPVWILGTPFFYEFHVGYDLSASPPAISFTSTEETPCVSCSGGASLLSVSSKSNRPRWTPGQWRLPNLDTDLPL
jgi:hypothetical protein